MAKRTVASKSRGRTSVTRALAGEIAGPKKSHRYTPNERKTQQNRGMDSGRGDRRDMSKTYSGTAKHAARGNTPRKDVKTRAR
jgi:hypothetical protein